MLTLLHACFCPNTQRSVAGRRSTGVHQDGFTLVELVSVLIVVSILAIVAMPRFFNRQVYDARTAYDAGLSTIRYGQKVAIAQHRPVYIIFNSSGVSACFDTGCTSPVRTVTDQPATTILPTGVNAGLNPPISGFYFNALGKPFNVGDVDPVSTFVKTTITLNGGDVTRVVTIEAETGYVY
jgi:MSHA pilin protein MshC